jgi:bifunctional DNA-binding transcriptional regulator/antitoxin component of YhaV-PrlF toxin-antitoxin module
LFIRVVCCFLYVGEVVLGGVCEVFVARVIAYGKVTVPRRVRDVLNLEEGDYVRITITEVIKKKKQERKGKKGGKKQKA